MEFYEDPHETSRAIYEQIVYIIEKNWLRVSQITVDRNTVFFVLVACLFYLLHLLPRQSLLPLQMKTQRSTPLTLSDFPPL